LPWSFIPQLDESWACNSKVASIVPGEVLAALIHEGWIAGGGFAVDQYRARVVVRLFHRVPNPTFVNALEGS
jgi:hypothetical protein